MDILDDIKQLKAEIEALTQSLQAAREQLAKTTDNIIRGVLERQISEIVDEIDRKQADIEAKETLLPEKRTNGHHKPESLEEEELNPDYRPDEDDQREN